MIGITLTTDQIRNAPAEVRRWIEHEVIASLGLAADAPASAQHPQATHLHACTAEDAAAVLACPMGAVEDGQSGRAGTGRYDVGRVGRDGSHRDCPVHRAPAGAGAVSCL